MSPSDRPDRSLPSPGARSRAIVAFTLLASLAACGGGDNPAPSPPPPPPPPPVESAYLAAGVTSKVDGTTRQRVERLVVIDPARPDAFVLAEPLVGLGGSDTLTTIPATRADHAAGTVTTLGASQVLFLDNGHLRRVDLRGGHDHGVAEVGRLSGLCAIEGAWPLTADGSDGWVRVRRAGPFDCDPSHGEVWFVRAQGSRDARQVVLPGHLADTPVLEDDDGLFAGVLKLGPGPGPTSAPLLFNDRELGGWQPVAAPGRGAGAFAADPARAGHGWVSLVDGVHEMQWSATGAAVGAVAFATPSGVVRLTANRHGVYAQVEDALYGAEDGAAGGLLLTPTHVPPLGTDPVTYLFDTLVAGADRVWWAGGSSSQVPVNPEYGLGPITQDETVLAWAPGGPAQWAASLSTQDPPDTLTFWRTRGLLGTRGDTAIVHQETQGVISNLGGYGWRVTGWRLAQVDGNDGTVTGLPGAQSPVRAATRSPRTAAEVVSTLDCALGHWVDFRHDATGRCIAGEVFERDLAGGTHTSLGTIRTVATSFTLQAADGPFTAGVPVLVPVPVSTGSTDLFLLVPGSGAAMRQVTHGGVPGP